MITLAHYGQDVTYKGRGEDSPALGYITLEHADSGDKVRLTLSETELQRLMVFINSVPTDSSVSPADEKLVDEQPTATNEEEGALAPAPVVDLDQAAEPTEEPTAVPIPDHVFPE